MDNTTPPPAFPATCVIKLNQFQYTFYQLWAQACLLEVLLDQMKENVELPPMAINSIAHVIEWINGHLKKPLSM